MTQRSDTSSASSATALILASIVATFLVVIVAATTSCQGINDSAFYLGTDPCAPQAPPGACTEGDMTSATAVEGPTQSAMDAWSNHLPRPLRSAVAWYVTGANRITMSVSGDTARARHSRVRRLCRRLAQTMPIGTASHVVLVAEAFASGHRLASITAGGTCHIHHQR